MRLRRSTGYSSVSSIVGASSVSRALNRNFKVCVAVSAYEGVGAARVLSKIPQLYVACPYLVVEGVSSWLLMAAKGGYAPTLFIMSDTDFGYRLRKHPFHHSGE